MSIIKGIEDIPIKADWKVCDCSSQKR